MKTLELPSDCRFKQDKVKPEQLFHQIDQVIEQRRNVVESAELYTSHVEIITKASANRAIRGIYHSNVSTKYRNLRVYPFSKYQCQ